MAEEHQPEHMDHHDSYEHDHHELAYLNHKRLFDEMMAISLTSQHRSQEHYDELKQQQMRHTEEIHVITLEGLRNAGTTHDMLAKQAIKDLDLATDRKWNFDTVSALAARTGVARDAIAAEIAMHVADHHTHPASP